MPVRIDRDGMLLRWRFLPHTGSIHGFHIVVDNRCHLAVRPGSVRLAAAVRNRSPDRSGPGDFPGGSVPRVHPPLLRLDLFAGVAPGRAHRPGLDVRCVPAAGDAPAAARRAGRTGVPGVARCGAGHPRRTGLAPVAGGAGPDSGGHRHLAGGPGARRQASGADRVRPAAGLRWLQHRAIDRPARQPSAARDPGWRPWWQKPMPWTPT